MQRNFLNAYDRTHKLAREKSRHAERNDERNDNTQCHIILILADRPLTIIHLSIDKNHAGIFTLHIFDRRRHMHHIHLVNLVIIAEATGLSLARRRDQRLRTRITLRRNRIYICVDKTITKRLVHLVICQNPDIGILKHTKIIDRKKIFLNAIRTSVCHRLRDPLRHTLRKTFQLILVHIHNIVSVKFCKYKTGNRRHDQQCDHKAKAYSPKYFLHIDSPVLTMSDIELKFVSKPPYRLNLPVGMLHFVQFGTKSLDM